MFLLEYKSKLHRILVHFLFWMSYLLFFALLSTVTSNYNFISIIKQGLLSLPIDIIATYFTIYYLLPKYLIKKKYFPFIAFSLLVGFATIVLNHLLQVYVFMPIYLPQLIGQVNLFNMHIDLYSYLVSSYSIVILAVGIKFIKFWVEINKTKSQLENQNLKSELNLLKSQLNPHFLFNVLNNIDSLIHTKPEIASQYIIKLSDILRYVTYEANTDYVPISKELDYLDNYIELSRLRFGNEYISFSKNIKNQEKFIAPMLFIPLVENAIKHGDKNTQIQIDLDVDEHICFTVSNYISSNKTSKDAIGGIGINNLQRRLQLIYPTSHRYEISHIDPNKYTAELWIK